MATGIEAAGLALELFPVIVRLLAGAEKIGQIRNYKKAIQRLTTELTVEHLCFRDQILPGLLENIVSPEKLLKLMNGEDWGDTEFQDQLQRFLGTEQEKLFTTLVQDLFQSLHKLQQDLGQQDGETVLSKKTWKKMRIVVAQRSPLEDISRTVELLRRLSTPQTHPARRPRDSRAGRVYAVIRKHAINLHEALLEKLKPQPNCTCSGIHNASLLLQRCPESTTQQRNFQYPRFSVLFSLDVTQPGLPAPWNWREVEFEVLNDSPAPEFSPPNTALTSRLQGARQIRDLCSALASENVIGTRGVIGSDGGWWYETSTAPDSVDYHPVLVSLEDLLKQQKLSRENRLRIGVKLASAVIQLHETEWMEASWGKKNIFFPQTAVGVAEPVIEKPLVRRSLDGSQLLQPGGGATGNSPRDKSLYSLGVILIELWFGRTIEHLREGNVNGSNEFTPANPTVQMDMMDLLQLLHNSAGERYWEATKACILGFGDTSATLHHDEFKGAVHVSVVRELERNLNVQHPEPC